MSLARKGKLAPNRGKPGYNRGGLTASERLVYNELRSAHIEVARGGWPDFLVLSHQGTIFGVEVKSGTAVLTPEQQRIARLLERAGVRVLVERV